MPPTALIHTIFRPADSGLHDMNIKNALLTLSLSMATAFGAHAAPPLIDEFDNGTFL